MMDARSTAWPSVLVLVLLLPACGSSVTPDDADAGAQPPVLPPGTPPPLEECTPPLAVTEGSAWVGGLRWIGGEIVPNGCDPEGQYGMVALRLRVPSFFLDADETTNACYQRCVEEGACAPPSSVEGEPAWDDPAMARVPALVDHSRAAAFCAWRKGRLPSIAELIRAGHGDALSPLNPALQELWLRCRADVTEPKPSDCGSLPDKVDSFPSPIRSWSLDEGPFGHFDIAASAIELPLTKFPASDEEEQALCSIPKDAPDPQDFGSFGPFGYFPGLNLLDGPYEDRDLAWVVWGSEEGALEGAPRCAYDPQ